MTSKQITSLFGTFRFGYDHGQPFPGEYEHREPEQAAMQQREPHQAQRRCYRGGQAVQDLSHGNEEKSFLAEFYKYAQTDNKTVNAFNTNASQVKMKTTKREKRISLFLPAWLASSKFSLKSILNNHFSVITLNSEYAKMFENISVCIMFYYIFFKQKNV